MKNAGNIFIGIIAAAAAGVVIGMLIAPEKGEDLRKRVKDSAGDLAKKLSDLMAEGKEQLQGLKGMLGESARELKDEALDMKNQVSESYKNGKG